MIPAIKYGITTRYNIPLLSPAPIEVSPLLTLFSTDALHMAHCADAARALKKLAASRTKILNFMYSPVFERVLQILESLGIIGSDHKVNNHACNGYVQPNGIGILDHFAVFVSLIGISKVIGKQDGE